MPWLVVGGLVVIVIWLASKTDSAKDDLLPTPTTATDFNPNLPLAGAATISPATAQGSYTAGRPYNGAAETFSPLVLPANTGPNAFGGFTKIAPATGAMRGEAINLPRRGTGVTAPTSNISQTLQVSPVPQGVQVPNARVLPSRTLSRPLTSVLKY